ncbi:MAG: hypothetical protein CM15mP84_04950 [Cellvibrionales bacterium]|nr:MAG: hypothetical protein CM15mP84_04950 [Cellvibrionales bacterium]
MTLEWDFGAVTLKSLTSYPNDEIAIQRDNDRHDLEPCLHSFLLQSYFDPENKRANNTTQEFNLISTSQPLGS